jgi:phosphoribosylformylglycinamidine synthase
MVAVSGRGVSVEALNGRGEFFAEFPGRFLVGTSDAAALLARAAAANVPAVVLGHVGGDALAIGDVHLSVEQVAAQRRNALEDQLNAN